MNKNKVVITDVTGRDGFQMEKEWINTKDKIDIIDRIIESGVSRVEATSFVSPKAIPQLQDAKEVINNIQRNNIKVVALIPNLKGAESAQETKVDEVNVVISVSETHNKKNINKTREESIEEIGLIHNKLKESGININVGLATTFGCPFEGLYSADKVIRVIQKLKEKGLNSFILSDTTGMANPLQITEFVEEITHKFTDSHFSLHLHNTRGMGLVNLYAGYQAGIRDFDAALGGIGGCPFAPGATGNLCLEDAIHMLELMNISTGIDIRQLIDTANSLEELLGRKLPGQVMKAGLSVDTYEV